MDNKIFKIGNTKNIPTKLFPCDSRTNNILRKINDTTEYSNNKILNNKTIFLFLISHNRNEITMRQILKTKKEDVK
jgi:hypothetical protein